MLWQTENWLNDTSANHTIELYIPTWALSDQASERRAAAFQPVQTGAQTGAQAAMGDVHRYTQPPSKASAHHMRPPHVGFHIACAVPGLTERDVPSGLVTRPPIPPRSDPHQVPAQRC